MFYDHYVHLFAHRADMNIHIVKQLGFDVPHRSKEIKYISAECDIGILIPRGIIVNLGAYHGGDHCRIRNVSLTHNYPIW